MSTLPFGYRIEPRQVGNNHGFAWVREDGREGVAYATRERAEQSARDYESASASVLIEWIREAAPLLQAAACIAADARRLDEVPGIRAVVEKCPVDFMPNDEDDSRRALRSSDRS